jgi:hypothetical protein
MKSSPYFKVFEEEALGWEDKLNRIRDTFDIWIDVQVIHRIHSFLTFSFSVVGYIWRASSLEVLISMLYCPRKVLDLRASIPSLSI